MVGEQIAARIDALLEEHGLSARQASFRLADLRPGSNPEVWRRMLRRWRTGSVPEIEQAEALAQLFGVDAEEFQPATATGAEVTLLREELEQSALRYELVEAQRLREVAELRDQLRRLQGLLDAQKEDRQVG